LDLSRDDLSEVPEETLVSKKKSYAPIIATPWKPPQAQKEFKRSTTTAERHMQIIAKLERLRYITPAKAKELRDRVLSRP
jgi:hypothetical protein